MIFVDFAATPILGSKETLDPLLVWTAVRIV